MFSGGRVGGGGRAINIRREHFKPYTKLGNFISAIHRIFLCKDTRLKIKTAVKGEVKYVWPRS